MIASSIVSRAIRASFEAPLLRSSAMAWIACSTGSGSMFHPRVVRREARDADADSPFEEVPRIPLRRPDRRLVELSEGAIPTVLDKVAADNPGTFRLRDDHSFNRGPGMHLGRVVTDQKDSQITRKQPPMD